MGLLSLEGVVSLFKDVLTSGPVEGVTKFADMAATVGEFFGWVKPQTKGVLDFARDLQDFLDHKTDGKEFANKTIQNAAQVLMTEKFLEMGWSPEIAFIASYIGKKLAGGLAGFLHLDSAVSSVAGMITGGEHASDASPSAAGRQRSGSRGATA